MDGFIYEFKVVLLLTSAILFTLFIIVMIGQLLEAWLGDNPVTRWINRSAEWFLETVRI